MKTRKIDFKMLLELARWARRVGGYPLRECDSIEDAITTLAQIEKSQSKG